MSVGARRPRGRVGSVPADGRAEQGQGAERCGRAEPRRHPAAVHPGPQQRDQRGGGRQRQVGRQPAAQRGEGGGAGRGGVVGLSVRRPRGSLVRTAPDGGTSRPSSSAATSRSRSGSPRNPHGGGRREGRQDGVEQQRDPARPLLAPARWIALVRVPRPARISVVRPGWPAPCGPACVTHVSSVGWVPRSTCGRDKIDQGGEARDRCGVRAGGADGTVGRCHPPGRRPSTPPQPRCSAFCTRVR